MTLPPALWRHLPLAFLATFAFRGHFVDSVRNEKRFKQSAAPKIYKSGLDYCVDLFGSNIDWIDSDCNDRYYDAVSLYMFLAEKGNMMQYDADAFDKYKWAQYNMVKKDFDVLLEMKANSLQQQDVCIMGRSQQGALRLNYNAALAIYFYTKERVETLNRIAANPNEVPSISVYSELKAFMSNELNWIPELGWSAVNPCRFAVALIMGLKSLPDPVPDVTRYSKSEKKNYDLLFHGETKPYFNCNNGNDQVPFTANKFLSTSTSTGTPFSRCAGGFVILETVRGFTRGKDVASLSAFPTEKEVLFPAGTRFKCLSHTVTVHEFMHKYGASFAQLPQQFWVGLQQCKGYVTWVREYMDKPSKLTEVLKKRQEHIEKHGPATAGTHSNATSALVMESVYPCAYCVPGKPINSCKACAS